ncbi:MULTISPECIES: type I toxin-antitoxin system Ibs family toxin [Escherichia]|nr:type I toxin-antitoxin system Ibs family toxin [Escherichia fergusonii]UBH87464.1 type I toxin-antitoxin system Ibs family toxin [Escherichia fergusonii]
MKSVIILVILLMISAPAF